MAFIAGDAGMTSRLVKLEDLVQSVSRWNPAKEIPDEEFVYLDLSSVDKDKKEITDASSHLGAEAPSRAQQLVQTGDVLVSTVRPNLNGVGYVTSDFDGVTASTGFCVLRSDPKCLDGRYLFHWVKTPRFVDDMVLQATGANYPAVSDKTVKASRIPLPSLEVQKRIASILDAADALRAKRRESLRKLEVLLKSVFLEMFGDPVTNPKGWDEIEIGKTAIRFSDGPFGSNLKSEHYQETGIQVIRLQNIGVGEFDDSSKVYVSEEHFQSLPRHHCKPGDVIIGTLGEPNLRACVLPSHIENALNKADCILYRTDPNFVTPEYACNLLNSDGMVSKASLLALGETRLRISMGRLKSLTMPVPPLELQHKFSGVIARFEKEKSDTLASLASLETLFSSLQDQAFNGTLDSTAPQLAQLEVQTSLF
jgi:type I restriction enzyme, S subunit